MNQLVDRFGREHTYLRISVTDRCNLRCLYCMPPEGIPVKPKSEVLTFEEIYRIARLFVSLGVNKIRITGGEPLVRRNLESLLADLSSIEGLKTLALTTNGVLLADKVAQIKQAGVNAINISLDTLQKDRFQQITLRDDFDNVMDAIQRVLKAEFESVKLNVVLMSGRNSDEILDFVDFAKDTQLNVRFIEFMPFPNNEWCADGVVSYQDMRQLIEQKYKLVPLSGHKSDVAKDFAIDGHTGRVSFISSMTDSFCGTCNRLRVNADGSIKSCLFYAPEIGLRDAMRAGANDLDLRRLILQAVQDKPESHPPMEELALMSNRSMVEIGG